MLRERRFGPPGHRDQRHAQALHHRQDHVELVALAGVGDRHHHVDRRDHAEVAMARLPRMHEHRRRAGGGQRGGDLAADVAALAHAHHDDAAAAAQHGLHCTHESVVQPRLQAEQRTRLDVESLAGQMQGAHGVEGERVGHGGRRAKGPLGSSDSRLGTRPLRHGACDPTPHA